MKFLREGALMLSAILFLIYSVAAQTQTQAPAKGAVPPQATASQPDAPSVLMEVELAKALDSKKAKAGDQVEAKTLQDMKAPNGADIPRGSRVVGHVTQASAHSKDRPQAQLGFVFEKIVTKSGQEFPLRGVLQAVSVPVNTPPNAGGGFGPGNVGGQDQGPQQGGPVGKSQSGMTSQAGSQEEQRSGGGGQAGNAGEGIAANAAPFAAPATGPVTGLKDVQLAPGPEPALSSSARNIHLDNGTTITVKVVPTPVAQ
jgi:hypothetical protein